MCVQKMYMIPATILLALNLIALPASSQSSGQQHPPARQKLAACYKCY